jgi:hypothetical protein
VPNQIVLNLTMRSQTKACIAKSSREIFALLSIMQGRVVIPYGYFGTTYGPIFKGKEIQKIEESVTEVN